VDTEADVRPLDPNDPAEAELARRLERHKRWWRSDRTGQRLDASRLVLAHRALEGLDLAGAELADCVFDGARLHETDFAKTWLTRCSFVRADLSSASFYKSQTTDSDFSHARLVGTYLTRWHNVRSCFRDADLSRADLGGSFFDRCDLRGARLRDAHLDRAGFQDCRLGGADFSGARGALVRYPIDVGTSQEPRIVDGDEALAWLRDAGAEEVRWFQPEPR
jgi:uncharacterized protein YjbI with pentapeptide repeats